DRASRGGGGDPSESDVGGHVALPRLVLTTATPLDKGSDAADIGSYAPGERAYNTMTVLSDFVRNLLTRFPMARWSPIPLRLIVGYGFMQHGFAKLSRGPDAFVAILQAMGVPTPHFMAWLTILTELLGGLAVLLGAFVTIVSVPMMAVLLVAMFTVHLPYG